ncbi:MAG: carboxymuconolactone decarboxylase family protein [Candidatus Krumholzibacteriota bacterium]|nr:carboxymuconolactone decarboxylase family protein [Candidatus Krumholzibacteriota bacterium]
MKREESGDIRGIERFREVDGKGGEKAVKDLEELVPEIGRYIIEFPFGDIYSRPGLDLRTRELAAIASLVTSGNCEPQLRLHIHAALNVGATRQEVIEVILQMAVYTGFPRALNALYTARDLFGKRDLKKKK